MVSMQKEHLCGFWIVVMIHMSGLNRLDEAAGYPSSVKSLITTKSNHLHWINQHRNVHCKIHLSKFIPPNIYNKYVNNDDANDDDGKCNQCDGLKEKCRIMEAEKT
eukprot:868272_1